MKKLLSLIAISSLLVACQPAEETNPEEMAGSKYQNEDYAISMMIPEDWGTFEVQETVHNDLPILKSFKVMAEGNTEKYIQINVVDPEQKDDPVVTQGFPHTFLSEGENYVYYYSADEETESSGEAAEIISSFE